MVVPPRYPEGESVQDQVDASTVMEPQEPGRSRGFHEALVLLGGAQPAGTGYSKQ